MLFPLFTAERLTASIIGASQNILFVRDGLECPVPCGAFLGTAVIDFLPVDSAGSTEHPSAPGTLLGLDQHLHADETVKLLIVHELPIDEVVQLAEDVLPGSDEIHLDNYTSGSDDSQYIPIQTILNQKQRLESKE